MKHSLSSNNLLMNTIKYVNGIKNLKGGGGIDG